MITALAPEYTVVKHRTVRRGDHAHELTILSWAALTCYTDGSSCCCFVDPVIDLNSTECCLLVEALPPKMSHESRPRFGHNPKQTFDHDAQYRGLSFEILLMSAQHLRQKNYIIKDLYVRETNCLSRVMAFECMCAFTCSDYKAMPLRFILHRIVHCIVHNFLRNPLFTKGFLFGDVSSYRHFRVTCASPVRQTQ